VVTVERIASLNEWLACELEWDDLLRRAGRTEVFLSHRWLTNWYRHFGQDMILFLLIVKEGTRWIGGLPLVRTREYWHGVPVRTLRFPINQESGNLRCECILSTCRKEIVAALIQYLGEVADEWDRWELSGLPIGSPAFPLLHTEMARSPWPRTLWQFERELSYLPISGSWEDYAKKRSYSFRKNLRLSENRMERLGAVILQVAKTPEEIVIGIERLFELDSRSSKAKRSGVIRLEGNVREFHRCLADSFGKSGDCRIDTLHIDGVAVAALFSLYSHGVLFFLYTCYDPASSWLSPGRVLFRRVLEDVWDQELREADFNGMTSFVRTFTVRPSVHGWYISGSTRCPLWPVELCL
jgi:hypothetical protein